MLKNLFALIGVAMAIKKIGTWTTGRCRRRTAS